MDTDSRIDLRLKTPFTMLVSGPTACGKTTFTRELLIRRQQLQNRPTEKVFYFYKVYQPVFDQMLASGVVDEFIDGMPTMEFLEKNIDNKPETCSTIVIDDRALEVDDDTAKMFAVGSHHYNTNIIFLCQNLFGKNKYFRDISLNSTYHVLFKNPRDKSIITNFAKQFRPGKTKEIAEIFDEATTKPHSYLFIDYHQETSEDHRLLSNYLFEDEEPMKMYKLK